MAEKEYIERHSVLCSLAVLLQLPFTDLSDAWEAVQKTPAADVVEVVRCENCKWFVPKHIRLDDGSTREYTEEEKKLPLGVPGNVGINCGSRCMRHISWLENSVPVWVQENDYCSYGERKEATP